MAQTKDTTKPQKRELQAVRTKAKFVIDGELKEDEWKKGALATNFVEWRPTYGKVEDETTKTEVYILYDDDAIYVGGICHEVSQDSIAKELVGRDVVGVNDFIGIMFDTYDDKINGFGYYVTALGEQFDAKYSSNGEDGSWSSVYETNTKLFDKGWSFEMKIPYAAIRFSKKPIQNWGMELTRRRSKSGKQFMWNPINPEAGGTLFAQSGVLKGLENIKPPLRLSFSPYFSTYLNQNPNETKWKNTINGGMDVKYGINQAFTLDMTLIPDFGQVQSDNQVLNLSPFEVRYNENRSFFTEGTELFGKGNFFYSRRIGGSPLHYWDVYNEINSNETVIKNPTETKLINATKISGRTSKGLGVGFFNAITAAQHATVQDDKLQTRQIETSPLTNYNILVLDQTLKNNSSVSFLNASTMRAGSDYDANITSVMWDVYDKKNKWNFFGKEGLSQLYGFENNKKTTTGLVHNLGFGKVSGRFNFNFNQDLATETYSQNDMGYLTNNNYLDHFLWMGYKLTKPKKWYNRLNFNFNTYYSRRFKPSEYQMFNLNTNVNGQLKNLWFVGMNVNYNANETDYYEARLDGYIFKRPERFGAGFWIGSNEAKKYSANIDFYYSKMKEYQTNNYSINFYNQFRFNKKLTLSFSNSINPQIKNVGFATLKNGIPIFASRDRLTVENTLNAKYNFNNKMGISLRTRHYWSKVENKEFYNLQKDGAIVTTTNLGSQYNYNINFFNVDMVYTWQFALGSFVNIVWKNIIQTADDNFDKNYFYNAGKVVTAAQQNNISVKVIYFLDYLKLKKHKHN